MAASSPASLVPALDSLPASIRGRIAQANRDRIKKNQRGGRKTSPPKFLPPTDPIPRETWPKATN
jgi:hypothetical protein